MEFRGVIGFDLGHGESSVAWAALDGQQEPAILEVNGRRTQVTAVARHPDRNIGIIVGERALWTPGVMDVQIGFKQRPPGRPDYVETLRDFVSAYRRILTETRQVGSAEEICWFVGCPSGWTAEELALYEAMLRDAGLPHVRVVRESRAALLQAKEAGTITEAQLAASVLVIDAGSSTVDVSHVCGGLQDEKMDAGMELGAALIERALLARVVSRHPRRDELAAFLAEPANRSLRNHCELACRRLKEEFWTDEDEYRRQNLSPTAPYIGLEGDLALIPTVDGAEMDEILATPLAELGGRCWSQAFGDILGSAHDALAAKGVSPAAVVLTGGAARMSFMSRMCRERFPGAALVRHPAPEEAVARGLARWGQIFLNTSAFSDEVLRLSGERVEPLVRERRDRLVAAVADEVSGGIVAEVVPEALRSWKQGDVRSLKDLDGVIADKAERWLRSSSGAEAITRACEDFLRGVAVDVDGWTLELCRRYGIPAASLRLDPGAVMRGDLPHVPVTTKIDTLLAATGIATFVAMLILRGMIGTVGVGTGPPGWVLAGSLGTLITMMSLPVVEEKIQAADLPRAVRAMAMTEAQLAKTSAQMRSSLRTQIVETLSGDEFDAFVRSISDQVSSQLEAKASEVKWIIS